MVILCFTVSGPFLGGRSGDIGHYDFIAPIIIVIRVLLQMGPKWEIHIGEPLKLAASATVIEWADSFTCEIEHSK